METIQPEKLCVNPEGLDDAIFEFVKQRGTSVNFVALQQHCEQIGVEAYGEWTISPGNVLFWFGLSHPLFRSLQRLIQSKRLHLHTASRYEYLIAGVMPEFPLATERSPSRNSWLPCSLCACPFPPSTAAGGMRG